MLSRWSDDIPPRPKYIFGPPNGPWLYIKEQRGGWRTVCEWRFEFFRDNYRRCVAPIEGYVSRVYLQRRRTSWLRRWWPWKTVRKPGFAEGLLCSLAELIENTTQEPDHA